MHRFGTMLFFLLVLLWLGITGQSATAASLSSECGGDEKIVSAMANKTTTLHTFNKPSQSLSLDCFASGVSSIKGGQNPTEKDKVIDYCLIDSQTEYNYNLAVRATYKDEKGVEQITDFSIRDIYTGSLIKPTFRMPVPSIFSIVFTNLATNDRCTLKLTAAFDYTQNTDPDGGNETEPIPALVAVRPPAVYPQNNSRIFFVLQYPKNVTSDYASMALVKLVSPQNNCQEICPASYMDYTTELPNGYVPPSSSQSYYARAYSFYKPGSYRVCYQAKGGSAGRELGIVTVFSSNPIYYETYVFTEDRTVYTGEPFLIKFYGYDLDTRKEGDITKFVDETDSCKDGAASAGVSINSNLFPKNNYGPNTTYAFWQVVTKKSGTYKVCYKRRGEEWVEVPIKRAAWPRIGPTSNSTPNSFPIPIDPVTKEACPTAPTDGTTWVAYSSLRFNMKKSKRMEEFANMIVNLFCVPRSAFTIIRMTYDTNRKQVVYIVFECTGVTLQDGRPACDSIERSNYAVALSELNSTLLPANDIDEILGSTFIAIADDDPDISPRNRSFMPILIICITALGCTGMLVFAVLKYRERRQYFVQFGMDDDGIDDMYIPAMMSPGEDGSGHPDTNHTSSEHLNSNSMRGISIKVKD